MTGQDIRAFRQRERLSQEALGGVLGVIHSSISNWERGGTHPGKPRGKTTGAHGSEPGGTGGAVGWRAKKAAKTSKRETAKICSCTSRQPLQGLSPLAAHGRGKKQNHVLRLHPGDRPLAYLRRRAYIPAAQGTQAAVFGRCQGGGAGVELRAV